MKSELKWGPHGEHFPWDQLAHDADRVSGSGQWPEGRGSWSLGSCHFPLIPVSSQSHFLISSYLSLNGRMIAIAVSRTQTWHLARSRRVPTRPSRGFPSLPTCHVRRSLTSTVHSSQRCSSAFGKHCTCRFPLVFSKNFFQRRVELDPCMWAVIKLADVVRSNLQK